MPPSEILKPHEPDYNLLKKVTDLIKRKKFDAESFHDSEATIGVNPNNYSVWWFRRRCLEPDQSLSLKDELDRVAQIILGHQKSYQLWYHRRWLVDKLIETDPTVIDEELDSIENIVDDDTKNHNYWEFRQWLVKRANLPLDKEYTMIEDLLLSDCRNNSIWNYREWLCLQSAPEHFESIRKRETKYALTWLERTPDNEAVVNYLLGWYEDPIQQNKTKKIGNKELSPLKEAHPLFKSTIAKLLIDNPTAFVLDIAGRLAWSEGNLEEALKIYTELASGKYTFYTGVPKWRMNFLQKIMAATKE